MTAPNRNVPMRVWVGAITTTLWIGVGAYTVLMSPSPMWRTVGVVEILVGLFRGWLWLRDYRRFKGQDEEDDWS